MIKGLIAAILSAFGSPASPETEHREIQTDGSEPPVIAALDAWLDAFEAQKIRIRKQLNAPASNAEIASFEQHIGYKLPTEARELYRFANGQKSPFKVTYRAPEAPNIVELPVPLGEGEYVGNLFGNYEFLSLQQATKNWDGWAEIRAGSTPEELALDFDGSVTVRDGDPVLKQYTHPAWIPFAQDGGGNAYALDLAPTEGGHIGQIIVIGPDEDFRRVLAPNLTEFFISASARGISFEDSEDHRAFFNMEND